MVGIPNQSTNAFNAEIFSLELTMLQYAFHAKKIKLRKDIQGRILLSFLWEMGL